MYQRFWFEFEIDNAFEFPPGIGIGCGVTAIDYDDALQIIDKKIFSDIGRPSIRRIIKDIDIRELDQGHVIPNMKVPITRGIWFPSGYE